MRGWHQSRNCVCGSAEISVTACASHVSSNSHGYSGFMADTISISVGSHYGVVTNNSMVSNYSMMTYDTVMTEDAVVTKDAVVTEDVVVTENTVMADNTVMGKVGLSRSFVNSMNSRHDMDGSAESAVAAGGSDIAMWASMGVNLASAVVTNETVMTEAIGVMSKTVVSQAMVSYSVTHRVHGMDSITEVRSMGGGNRGQDKRKKN